MVSFPGKREREHSSLHLDGRRTLTPSHTRAHALAYLAAEFCQELPLARKERAMTASDQQRPMTVPRMRFTLRDSTLPTQRSNTELTAGARAGRGSLLGKGGWVGGPR